MATERLELPSAKYDQEREISQTFEAIYCAHYRKGRLRSSLMITYKDGLQRWLVGYAGGKHNRTKELCGTGVTVFSQGAYND